MSAERDPKHFEKLWSMIRDIGVAMMTTHDGHDLRSRPMQSFQNEFTGKLYFYSKLDSHKALEVERDHAVNLAYADQDDHVYVSVTGTARLTRDPELIDRYWSPHVSAWFPKGKDEPELGLIEVDAHSAEYWDSDTSSMRYLFEVARANVQETRPNIGDHGRVQID